jgi:methylated-DNA-[protein]-cysteine S-methyltransferase
MWLEQYTAVLGWQSMGTQFYCLFATAIGHCGIVWSKAGVVGVQLPERERRRTRERIEERFAGAVMGTAPPAVIHAIDSITALFAGARTDLSAVPLDLEGISPFHRRVYAFVRTIRPGAILTYGEIATRIGAPGAARAVGRAMAQNPFPIIVPCHRVVAAGGKTGGFSAYGGVATKRRLLEIEGAPVSLSLAL